MIVVDSSALLAILLAERDAELYRTALKTSEPLVVSAVNLHETLVVLVTRRGTESRKSLWALLDDAAVDIAPFDKQQATLATEAYARYGKGLGSKAQLNLCDCAAYGLARHLDAPLLFKGEDFSHTDVKRRV